MSCITLSTYQDSPSASSMPPCKKITIAALVVAYLILVWLLDPTPLFSSTSHFPQYLDMSQAHSLPRPPSLLSSVFRQPSCLCLFIKCILNHIPYQMAPKIQLVELSNGNICVIDNLSDLLKSPNRDDVDEADGGAFLGVNGILQK